MNLKGKIVLITVITIIALVGVGFASWTITTSADSNIGGVSGVVTAAIEAEGVQVKTADGSATVSALYIICDSPTSGNGIYWSTTNDATAYDNKITQVKLVGSVNEDDNDIADIAKYTGNFSCSFAGVSTATYINVPAIALNEDVVSASKNADVEYLYTLPTLTYKTVPNSVAEVNALETEVNALNLTITFSFSVKSVSAE